MWRMRVVHATGYAYKSPVTASFNEARLTPRSDSRQNVILNRVETVPAPWMTAADSPNREPASVTYPVQLKRFDGV